MIGPLTIAAFAVGLASAQAHDAPSSGLELPTGRLQLMSGNDRGGFFVDLERTRVQDGRVHIHFLHMAPEPYGVAESPQRENWVLMSVERAIIDCQARTFESLGNQGYSEDGRPVVGTPPEPARPIRRDEGPDFFARALCDGETPPSPVITGGHVEARQVIARIFAARTAR